MGGGGGGGGEVSATELERKDAEAQGLCHEMTQRLKVLHEEKTALSSDLRTLSARRSSSSPVGIVGISSLAYHMLQDTSLCTVTVVGDTGYHPPGPIFATRLRQSRDSGSTNRGGFRAASPRAF